MSIEKVTLDDIKKVDDVFVMPEPFPYELPFGVVPNQEICDAIMYYGLFFWKNELYVIGGSKKKKTDDDDSNDVKWFKSVSNFKIEILQHMEDEKFPMRLITIRSIHGRKRTFECASKEFAGVNSFKLMIEGKGNYQFKGSTMEYEKLKGYLMDNMGDGRMIDVLGWQPEGFFAFNNAAVDSKVHKYTKYGGFEYKDINFYIRSANDIYEHNHTVYSNQKKVLFVDSGIRFKDWNKQMVKVHREPAMISICFAIACVFSDHIFKMHSFFPMMFLYGAAGTGKSKMIEQLQTLFGTPQSPITITGKANTDKAKIRKFAQFNNMMVFLEEFRNTCGEDMIEMLKALWNRMGYERGNIESAYGTDTVPISSGVMMTGNDYPSNDALLMRLIVVEMMKNSFSAEDKENFRELQEMERLGYSSIISELVEHRAYFVKEYVGVFNEIKKELAFYMSSLGLTDRNIDNLSVLLAVYQVMAPKLNFSFGKEALKEAMRDAIRKQNLKRDIGGEVSQFWDIFSQLMRDNILIKANVDYKVEGDHIYIRYSRVQSKYLVKHYEILKKSGVTKSTLKDKLQEHNSFVEYKSAYRIGGSTSTAMCFDLNKIDGDSRDSIFLDWYNLQTDGAEKRKIKEQLIAKELMAAD